ncbi:MAG TPA: RNA polymerase sigma factor [Steroidobacteraceae bacterium]
MATGGLKPALIRRSAGEIGSSIEEIFRREAGRVLATLIRLLGDFDLAEEAQQDAFAAALEQWPMRGMPDNPRAWLISTGRNRAIDRIRREVFFRENIVPRELAETNEEAEIDPSEAIFGDDALRLIFTCCHPALNDEAQIALTLREVCGLSTQAVARAFLVSEETMAQRLVRAKKKIRDAGIPYETPHPSVLDQRIEGVLAVVYGVFTEGYAATAGSRLIDVELCAEAIRLGRLLDSLLPKNSAVMGLLALMLLHDARHSARVTDGGDVILLDNQDRSRWDQGEIAEGLLLVDKSLGAGCQVSPYAVQAAIAALHVRAVDRQATDWPQIIGLYEVLLRLQPTPVIELNHAVAVSMVDGAERALNLVDSLAARGDVTQYHLLHAARGRFLEQLGRLEDARDAYGAALKTAALEPERRFLASRIAGL